jgi:uncharacterized Zn finger protein (UPF0148 family)
LENEEAGFGTIRCPRCGEAIPINEAIHRQIAEQTRDLLAKEDELKRMTAALNRTISKGPAAERANLRRELEARDQDTARQREDEHARRHGI